MMRATKIWEELQIGDQVTFCFNELGGSFYGQLHKESTGLWRFEGFLPCTVNCDESGCKGKMKFSNGDREFFRCLYHIVDGKLVCPILVIHKKFQLEDELFDI